MGKKNNLSVRFQPYEGTLLAEVAEWLNSLPSKQKRDKIEAALTMAYLAYARGAKEDISDEELRRCCVDTVDTLQKHGVNIFHYFQIPYIDNIRTVESLSTKNTEEKEEEVEEETELTEEEQNLMMPSYFS